MGAPREFASSRGMVPRSGTLTNGFVSELVRLARARCAAVVLTAALPVLPAYLLSGGIMYVATASADREITAPTKGEQIAERQRELGDRVPHGDAPSDSAADTRRDLLRGSAASPPAKSSQSALQLPPFRLAFLAGLALATGLLIMGLFLAQAALLPVVAGCGRASEAWATVARRFGPLFYTTVLAIVLIMVGLACFALPGFVLAIGFSLAAPVVVAEGIAGSEALQRSWDLMRRAWRAQLAVVFVGAIAVLAIRWIVASHWQVHGLAGRIVLNALVFTLVLPFPIAASAMVYLGARRVMEGTDKEALCQSIGRISGHP